MTGLRSFLHSHFFMLKYQDKEIVDERIWLSGPRPSHEGS